MHNLKMKLGLFSLLLAIASSVFLTSCEQQSIIAESPRFEVLDNLFSQYQVVTIANDELLALSEERKEEGFVLDLMIQEKPDWSFSVEFHDFYAEDYKAYESDANGDWVEIVPTDRSDAFHGLSLDKKSRAMFIMEDEQFSGEIYEGDIQYGLEPLTEFVPNASLDQYVYYRLDADIAGNQMECGNTDDDRSGEDPSGIGLRADCRNMSVTYIADYEYYKKFDKSSSKTRSYIEKRLKYGSYRYWGYNEYPLYFRLWKSYVKRNTSDRPATSSDKATFLRQWRSWGRDGNIGQADANLLYTGRNFGGLYGIAYANTVCRRYNGERRAYSFITKVSGVSSPVYSKVTGHEIGHLLGASHTSSGFMKQGNHSNSSMPQTTHDELDDYISDNNSCMSYRDCVGYDD